MNFDWKHFALAIGGLIGGPLLAIGLGWLHTQGVDLPCPAAPSAVISAPGK